MKAAQLSRRPGRGWKLRAACRVERSNPNGPVTRADIDALLGAAVRQRDRRRVSLQFDTQVGLGETGQNHLGADGREFMQTGNMGIRIHPTHSQAAPGSAA